MDMMPLFIGTHQTRIPGQTDIGRAVDIKFQSVLIMYDIKLVNQVSPLLPLYIHCDQVSFHLLFLKKILVDEFFCAAD